MKKLIKLSATTGLVAMVLSTMVFSFAMADLPITPQVPPNIATASDLIIKINSILNWVFTIALILAVVFILIAGFDFITAGGDAAKLSEARQKLIWAVVGIVIAGIAKGLPYVVATMLGVTAG